VISPRVTFLLSTTVLLSSLARAQSGDYTQIGIPENSPTISIPQGFIAPLTGQVHLEIPIAVMPTRSGVPVKAQFTYNTTFWGMKTGIMQKVYGKGLLFEIKSDTDASPVADQGAATCPINYTGSAHTDKYHRVIDSAGRVHYMPGTNQVTYRFCTDKFGNVLHDSPQILSSLSTDGEYYFLIRAGQPSNNGTFIWKIDGTFVVGAPYDTNGNNLYVQNTTPGEFTTNPVTITTGPTSQTINVKASDGATHTYIANYTTYGSGSTAVSVITSIVLPDGTQYGFSYDSTSGYPLTGMTLPTGGQVSFVYNPALHDYTNLNPQLVSATFEGGTWTFNQTKSSAPIVITSTVTGPTRYDFTSQANVNDKTIYTSTVWNGIPAYPFYLASAQFYSGASTLLKTVNAVYATSPYSCLQSLSTTLNDTGQTSSVQYQYGSACSLPTQKQEFDYGAAVPTRTTKYTYLQDTPSIAYNSQYYIYNRPTSINVYAGDGTGSPISSTTFAYDEYSANYCQPFKGAAVPGLTSIAGAINHRDSDHGVTFVARGNVTSTSKLVSGSTYITSHACYDTLGNVTQTVDERNNATNVEYTENWADANCESAGTLTRTLPTIITDPMGMRRKNTYYSCTHMSQALANENDILQNRVGTTYTYDFLNRLLCTIAPDGGQSCNSYFIGARPPYSTQVKSITPTLNMTATSILDGWGRVSQTQLLDPDGTDYTDTTYDSLGNVATVSNPYRSTADGTYGVGQNNYDALGRPTRIVEPDGSTVIRQYSGNCVTKWDEASKSNKECSDAFGRINQVWEDQAGVSYLTIYAYDALSNLTCVEQHGSASTGTGCSSSPSNDATSPWRIRRFGYDSLSRLLSSSNPESGTVTYTYDNSGNVLSRTAPQANQIGSATTTTSYCYDSLNRMTGKAYTAQSCPLATPAATYGYDGVAASSCAPPSLSDSNPKGERTSMCDASGTTSWAHDQMGRILTEKRTILGTSAWTKTAGYTYNLDGSIATIINPGVGRVMTYTTNGAGRQQSVVNTGGNINFATNATYAAFGGLATYANGTSLSSTDTYNSRLQPLTQSTINTTTSQAVMNITYDFHLGTGDNGNVFRIVNNRNTNRTQNFMYDSLNRIQQAYTDGPNWGETFSSTPTAPGVVPPSSGIDAWGNLTNRTSVTGKTNYELLNAAPANLKNQLTGFGYDAAGNMTSNGSATYTYDADNRLIGTAGWTYVYDGDGHRVKKTNGTSGTLYWPDLNGNALNESSLGATNLREYVYFAGRRVARIDVPTPLTVKYYFSDRLGSANVITDAGGTILEESDYFPYGGEIVVSGSDANTYKFTGKERDAESGLDDFGARHYASSLGHFMQADPVTVTAARQLDPQQMNLYAYVRNNPLKLGDSTGMYIDETQLTEKDLEKWHQAEEVAAQKDAKGNLVNKALYDAIVSLQADSRTYTLLGSSGLGQGEAGRFTITQFTAGGTDFTAATIKLDFDKIKDGKGKTSAEFGLDYTKFGGLNANAQRFAELIGHEFAHGLFAQLAPNLATNMQHGLDSATQEMNAFREQHQKPKTPLPPDILRKLDHATKMLDPTEKFAQSYEKDVNQELQASQGK